MTSLESLLFTGIVSVIVACPFVIVPSFQQFLSTRTEMLMDYRTRPPDLRTL
jgi:hypothetical protein